MIIAGIVLYNPDKEILKQNIESIRKQVDEVVVINNASTISISWLYEFIADRNINISIIENTLNRNTGKQHRMQLLTNRRKWTWNIQRNGGLKRILKQLQH